MSKMSKFEIELPAVPKPAKLSLSERDIAVATMCVWALEPTNGMLDYEIKCNDAWSPVVTLFLSTVVMISCMWCTWSITPEPLTVLEQRWSSIICPGHNELNNITGLLFSMFKPVFKHFCFSNLFLLCFNCREGTCKKTHVLKLNTTGKFALNVVDNLVVVHHQSSQVSFTSAQSLIRWY